MNCNDTFSGGRLILHNSIQQIPLIEGFFESLALGTGIDHKLKNRLNLALEEALSNIVLYAYPDGKDAFIEIDAVPSEGKLAFIISDDGAPFDPTSAPEAVTSGTLDDRPVGGLGLFLIRNIMDEVTYERRDGKNILKLIKNI